MIIIYLVISKELINEFNEKICLEPAQETLLLEVEESFWYGLYQISAQIPELKNYLNHHPVIRQC